MPSQQIQINLSRLQTMLNQAACQDGRLHWLQEGIFDEFSKAVMEKVKIFQLRGGLDPNTTLGPLISQAALKTVRKVSAPHALLPPQLPFALCTFAVPNLNCRLPSSRPCGQAIDSVGIILRRPFNQRICRLRRHSSLITMSNILRCLHFIIKKRH